MPIHHPAPPGPDPLTSSGPATSATPAATDNTAGASWLLLSVLTSTVMTLAVKWTAAEIETGVIVTLRAVGGLAICLVALLVWPPLRAQLRFSAPWLHVWRGALIGVATQFGFYTMTQLPLATVTVLFFTAPIFVALMSVPLHGERIGPRRGAAIAAGFLGVLIVMRPGAEGFQFAMLTGLCSSVLFSLALLSSRGLANRDGAFAAYLSSAVMTIIVAAPVAAPVWSLPWSTAGWVGLGLVTVSAMARNIADIQAYRLADAAVLAPLTYLRLILIAIASYFVFDETPDRYALIGGAVIIAAALYIARRERLVKRRA